MLTMEPQDGFERYLTEQAWQAKTPISSTFELLPLCNMDCRMCYVRLTKEQMEQAGSMLPPEKWLEIGREAAEAGTLFILLTGGEPLLYPEFTEVYRGLRSLGMIVTVNTNGTMITEELAELWKADLPRRINISLYGTNDAAYERLCGNPKGFTQVSRGIRLLKEAGIPMKLNYTLTPANAEEMHAVMQLSDQWEIPVTIAAYLFPPGRKYAAVHGNSPDEESCPGTSAQFRTAEGNSPVGDGCTAPCRVTPEEAARAQFELLEYLYADTSDYKRILMENLERLHPEFLEGSENLQAPASFLCTAAHSSCWVNWKGEMTPCGMLDHPARNLRKETFPEAWNNLRKDTEQIRSSNTCFHCRYRRFCPACPAGSFAETGRYDLEPEYLCRMSRAYEKILEKELRQQEAAHENG